MKESVIDN